MQPAIPFSTCSGFTPRHCPLQHWPCVCAIASWADGVGAGCGCSAACVTPIVAVLQVTGTGTHPLVADRSIFAVDLTDEMLLCGFTVHVPGTCVQGSHLEAGASQLHLHCDLPPFYHHDCLPDCSPGHSSLVCCRGCVHSKCKCCLAFFWLV